MGYFMCSCNKKTIIFPCMRNVTSDDPAGKMSEHSELQLSVSKFVAQLGQVWGGGNSYIKRYLKS